MEESPVVPEAAPVEEVPVEEAEPSEYFEFNNYPAQDMSQTRIMAPVSAPVQVPVPAPAAMPVPAEPAKPKKKKNPVVVISIIAVVFVAIAAGAIAVLFFLTKPSREYQEGEKAFASGDYANAATHFKAAGNYEDAEDRYEEVTIMLHYANGKEAFVKGEFDKAIEEFKLAGNYKDASIKVQEAETASCYAKGVSELNAGNYSAAVELFNKSSGYKDTADQLKKCYFKLAEAAEAKNDIKTAADYYKLAGDYEKAAEKSLELFYKSAEAELAAGNKVSAAQLFTDAGSYKDAAGRAKEIYYDLGIAALEKEDYDHAAEYLLLVGNYKDAATKGKEAYYQKACSLLNAGNYAEASKYFNYVTDYKDVQTILRTTVNKLISEKDYDNARSLVAYYSGDEAYKWGKYIDGMIAFNNKDYETACTNLAEAGTFQDAKARLKDSRYEQGGKLMSNGDFDGARKYFVDIIHSFPAKTKNKTILADKRRAQDLVKVCDAEKYYNQGNIAKAAELYRKIKGSTKITGFSVQHRATYISAKSSYQNARGEWSVKGNRIAVDSYYYNYGFENTTPIAGQYVKFSFTENTDDTFNCEVTVCYVRYKDPTSNDLTYVTLTRTFTNLSTFPFAKKNSNGKKGVDMGDNTWLEYSGGFFKVTFQLTNYDGTYQSIVTYKKK